MHTSQAVILVGGLGSRLGKLTASTPKPLLPVGEEPFLDHLLFELARHGIRRIVLAARFGSQQISQFAAESAAARRFDLDIGVSVEPQHAGTGGALLHAATVLDEAFYVLNGDSWLDMNLLSLPLATDSYGALASMALCHVNDASRFGVAKLAGARIQSFEPRQGQSGPGLINGGIYHFRKDLLRYASPVSSLEEDILAKAAAQDELIGVVSDGYFIDIGVPASYARAQIEVPAKRRRPAAFIDPNSLFILDHSPGSSVPRLSWNSGACEAVRELNDCGYYVFVVADGAAGVHDLSTYAAGRALPMDLTRELARFGAHVDAFHYRRGHADGTPFPSPDLLAGILSNWPVDRERSLCFRSLETEPTALLAGAV